MALHLIAADITKLEVDAIVNAANCGLLGGGGVDGCIHRAAGPQLLAECKTLGGCSTGSAKITQGYNLPCKYVIHAVGPVWYGGQRHEKELLTSCYQTSLRLAVEHGCQSLAFSLISAGVYGYPLEQALEVAVTTIQTFLREKDLEASLEVYLTLFDKRAYDLAQQLYPQLIEAD